MTNQLAGLYGLLIGDALGVPYEFQRPERLPPFEELDLVPPMNFARSHRSVPPGTWSDDGAMALCLYASLRHCGRLDIDDLAERFVAWWQQGYLAVDGIVFDIGVQTSSALRAIQRGMPILKAARNNARSNGNGSLMRALPLALLHTGTDSELVIDAHLQSRITHPHIRSQVCCAIYCVWARQELIGAPDAYAEAVDIVTRIYDDFPNHAAELEFSVQPLADANARGSGYVVDTLRSAVIATRESTFERIVRRAVAFGHDTDTTAAVAGGIAGIRHGFAGIPARWLEALRGRTELRNAGVSPPPAWSHSTQSSRAGHASS